MDFNQIVEQVGPWLWVIGGLVLLGLEILVPGTFFLWFGISAIVVGALAILFNVAWQAQVVTFGILAVLLVVFLRPWFNRRRPPASDANLNERAARLIGTSYVLTQPIVNGSGRVRIGDANWLITGPDTASGRRVRVTGADGTILTVEPVPE